MNRKPDIQLFSMRPLDVVATALWAVGTWGVLNRGDLTAATSCPNVAQRRGYNFRIFYQP